MLHNGFYIGIAKNNTEELSPMIFKTYKEADNYFSDNVEIIARWILIHYEFGKATLIHDCAGNRMI